MFGNECLSEGCFSLNLPIAVASERSKYPSLTIATISTAFIFNSCFGHLFAGRFRCGTA